MNKRWISLVRQTQVELFGRLIRAGPSSGLSFPDYTRGENVRNFRRSHRSRFDCPCSSLDAAGRPGPALCEISGSRAGMTSLA